MEVDGGDTMDMAEVEQPTKLVTEQVDLLLRAQVCAVLHSVCSSTSCYLTELSSKPAVRLAAEWQQSCCPAARQLGLCTVQLPRDRDCPSSQGRHQLVRPLHCFALLANPAWQPVTPARHDTPPCVPGAAPAGLRGPHRRPQPAHHYRPRGAAPPGHRQRYRRGGSLVFDCT